MFDLIQCAYKPLLKGKGVVESDTQERGAPDYRRQGTLDLEQFTAIVLRCVLFTTLNISKQALSALLIWQALASRPPLLPSGRFAWHKMIALCQFASDPHLLYALLPRADGKSHSAGLNYLIFVFQTALLKNALLLPD